MRGPLKMNFNHIEDIANPRDGKSDPIPYQYFSQWYMKFHNDNIKIDVKNPIDMGNNKIIGLKDPLHHSDAAKKEIYILNSMVSKADKTEMNNYILKRGLTSNLDMKSHNINNVNEATSHHQAVNFTQLNNELSNYLHETGSTMKGDIDLNGNSIYGIQNTVNKTSAVNREYVNNGLNKKLDKNKDVNMGGNKILSYKKPNDLNELVNKSYVDQKVSQASGSVDLSDYFKKDASGNLNLNNQKVSLNSDGINLDN